MKIGINGFEAVVGTRFGIDKKTGLPKRVGSSEYCYQLLKGLHKFRKKHDFYIYLPIEKTKDLPEEDENWHYVIISQPKLWTLIGLTKYFFKNRINLDIFFSPTHYAPLYSPGRLVISVMDLSYLYFPELFNKKDLWQLKLWTYFSMQRASQIFTISHYSKNDIIKKYHREAKDVVVTYLGIKDTLTNMRDQNQVLEKYSLGKKYILFVGTIQPRKNITRLIEAFSCLSNYPETTLVIVGKPGWMYEKIFAAPEKYGVNGRVKFLTEVSDQELKVLYQKALFFILPSLYEGFGLPVLEAMSFGTPVIISNVSSLPEAGGEAALYVDPANVRDIAEKMETLLKDDQLRKKLIEKGYQHVKKFSWEKTAEETLKALEELN